MTGGRARRLALNESRFRDINERLRRDLAVLPAEPETAGFVCECSRVECSAVLELPLAAYEAVRATPTRFWLRAGHEQPEVERVVERRGDVVVVEKLRGAGVGVTERTDPRA